MNILVIGGDMHPMEQMAYWDYLTEKLKAEKRELDSLVIRVDECDPDFVELSYRLKPLKFERIRRITGYLVGDLDSFNNAKRAEEHDRVKHG